MAVKEVTTEDQEVGSVENAKTSLTKEEIKAMFNRTIDPYEDEVAVRESDVTDDDRDGTVAPTDDGFAGKSKDELAGQLRVLNEQLKFERERSNPMKDLADQLAKRNSNYQNVPDTRQSQVTTETSEQRQQRLDLLWASDPTKAAMETSQEQIKPLVELLVRNQVANSKDMLVSNVDTKRLYDRWSDEIEREVQNSPVMDKVQNPRIYQAALEKVKSRHLDELITDLVEQRVKERLGEGAVTVNTKVPAVYSPAGTQRTAQAPAGGGKKTLIIPDWVSEEAFKQGVDEKFYYHHLKNKGLIR
jgi:hypothetical protein